MCCSLQWSILSLHFSVKNCIALHYIVFFKEPINVKNNKRAALARPQNHLRSLIIHEPRPPACALHSLKTSEHAYPPIPPKKFLLIPSYFPIILRKVLIILSHSWKSTPWCPAINKNFLAKTFSSEFFHLIQCDDKPYIEFSTLADFSWPWVLLD